MTIPDKKHEPLLSINSINIPTRRFSNFNSFLSLLYNNFLSIAFDIEYCDNGIYNYFNYKINNKGENYKNPILKIKERFENIFNIFLSGNVTYSNLLIFSKVMNEFFKYFSYT